MKKIFGYLVTTIIAMLIGAGIMYCFIKYIPENNDDEKSEEPVNKIQRNVTVTDTGISEGIENIYNAVVVVENFRNNKLSGTGSGFIYNDDGYIMTNHHVIEKATELSVILMSGETISAKLIGSDVYADIAVIKIDKKFVRQVATIGKSEESKVGDTVFTIGSPMSSEYAGTVTRGILSGKNRMVEVAVNSTANDWVMNVMQTDAAINPGNSGGPLCNVNGDVIGINSMKIVQSEIEGIGFAIPIEEALDYASKIVSGEKIVKPLLGVTMLDISNSNYYLKKQGISIDSSITSGVIVYNVLKNGPAEKAGLLKGDVIIKVGNYDVTNSARLKYYLSKYKPKETIDVKVIRNGVEKIIKVTLEESE